jgi:hypothetical protein
MKNVMAGNCGGAGACASAEPENPSASSAAADRDSFDIEFPPRQGPVCSGICRKEPMQFLQQGRVEPFGSTLH